MTFTKYVAVAVCSYVQLTNAMTAEEQLSLITIEDDQMTVLGKHEDHTTTESGKFKHPFVHAPSNVNQINYPDSKTFSVKLEKRQKTKVRTPTKEEQEPSLFDKAKAAVFGQSASYKIPSTRTTDYEYVGSVYMGSQRQHMTVAYDTASDYLFLGTDLCTNCDYFHYFTSDSRDFELVEGGSSETRKYDGDLTMTGVPATDQVCLSRAEQSCSPKFEWMAAKSQRNLGEVIDGVLGLQANTLISNIFGASPLLVPELYNQGVIDQNKFSFYLANTDILGLGNLNFAFIDFGAPNEALMRSQRATYLDIDFWEPFWATQINGLYFENDPTTKYQVKSYKARTDTGTAFISAPKASINFLRDTLRVPLGEYWWDHSDYGYTFPCERKDLMQNFYLALGGRWFQVRPKDYVMRVEGAKYDCALALDYTNENYWILGDAFIKGYYLIHDYGQGRLGFVPTEDGNMKPVPAEVIGDPSDDTDFVPAPDGGSGMPWWAWLIIALLGIGVAVGTGVGVTEANSDEGSRNQKKKQLTASNTISELAESLPPQVQVVVLP